MGLGGCGLVVGWEDGSGHWRGKRLSEKLTDDFPSIIVRGGDVVGLVQTAIHRIHPDLRIHVGAVLPAKPLLPLGRSDAELGAAPAVCLAAASPLPAYRSLKTFPFSWPMRVALPFGCSSS